MAQATAPGSSRRPAGRNGLSGCRLPGVARDRRSGVPGVMPYCNASAAGITGHQAIVAAHVVYFWAALHWFRRLPVTPHGAWLLPACAAVYALDSALWHL